VSDYAGSILQVAGAIVSIWFPPVGAAMIAAGGALNAYQASQQVIPGPKIGDAARQTSQEGGFRVIVYGRSYPFMGNIIADGGPVIVTKRESQGKGGPKVETESAYRTYAVGVCEGQADLLQVWRNGILVYDIEDPSMGPENAKFLEYARWFNGSFTQNASPDLEAIYGAGNAPYFRGTAYLVLAREDVTDQRAAWSQWQFRVFRGSAKVYTTPPYVLETTIGDAFVDAHGIALNVQPQPVSYADAGVSVDVSDLSVSLARVQLDNEETSDAGIAVEMANLAVWQARVQLDDQLLGDPAVSTQVTALDIKQSRVLLDNQQNSEASVGVEITGLQVDIP